MESEPSGFRRLTRYERLRRDVRRSRDSPVPTWVYAAGLAVMIGVLAAIALFVH
jgi:uncharacterized membrane protein YidH (DUF202 family)